MQKRRLFGLLSLLTIFLWLMTACTGQPAQGQGGFEAKTGQGPVTLNQPSPTPEKVSLGKAEYKDPEPAKLIETQSWGEVPVNQVVVGLKDGQTRTDAERIAAELGGTIVGEIEFINLYQIETRGTSEADLQAALVKVSGLQGVESSFPNTREYGKESACKACGPLSDAVYGEGANSVPYDMIRLKDAWDIIKASGVKLDRVTVGVLDRAIYTKSGEVGGKTSIVGIGAGDSTDQPATDDKGKMLNGGLNHGTMVSHIIAADPDNGGVVGVAAPLADKLTVKVSNLYKAQKNFKEAKADPDDPTKVVLSDGKTYQVSDFVHAIKQIEAGSTIINCSFGPKKPEAKNQGQSEMWKKFLQKAYQKYPKVLFVAAAGNENGGLDGKNYSIGGHKLPNLITVGALDNLGNRAKFSNYATGDGEVTISAPGVQIPMGVGPDGKTVRSSGTSFSTPMVTAAAALIRSINPNLSAEQIKKVLEDTANPSDRIKDKGMGKGVLRVDDAVLKVINDLRVAEGKPKLGKLDLEALTTIEGSVSMKNPKEYTVKASITAVGDKGTDVSIQLTGEGNISGSTKKNLAKAGEVTWEVTLQDEKKTATVRLTRLDTDSACDLQLQAVDLNGKWTGTLTIVEARVASDLTIPDPFDEKAPPTVIKKEDCEKSIKEQMGKPGKFVMEFLADTPTSGRVTMATSDKNDKPQYLPYKFDGQKVTITESKDGSTVRFEGTVTGDDKNYTMKGPFSMIMSEKGAEVLRISGTFEVTKPKPKP